MGRKRKSQAMEDKPTQDKAADAGAAAEDGSQGDDFDQQKKRRTDKLPRSQKLLAKLSKVEIDRKVADLTRFLVFKGSKRSTVSMREMTDAVNKKDMPGLTTALLELVQDKLHVVFGLELVNLPVTERKDSQPIMLLKAQDVEVAETLSTSYVLVNKISSPDMLKLMNWDTEMPTLGLLMTILSFIYMNKHELNEDTLWHHLEKVGVHRKQQHKALGPIVGALDSFYSQRYLTRFKQVGADNKRSYKLRWGPRARVEFSEESIIRFMALVYKEDADLWLSQLRGAEEPIEV